MMNREQETAKILANVKKLFAKAFEELDELEKIYEYDEEHAKYGYLDDGTNPKEFLQEQLGYIQELKDNSGSIMELVDKLQ